jgi:ElaB/YqjD/DUF883 family membrane-anchored ribosome-binding protein
MNEISTDKLVADVKVLLTDVDELIAATVGMAGDRVVELRNRLERTLAQSRTAMVQWEKDLRQRSAQIQVGAVACWRDEQWRRLATAVGVGLFFGLVLRWRR